MIQTLYFLFLHASALTLTLACAGADTSTNANHKSASASTALYAESADPVIITPSEQTDGALANIRRADSSEGGELPQLTPEEHMRRAAIYHANRAFNEARAHWQALLSRYPEDPNVPPALFLIGRSLFQERRYEEAIPFFDRLGSQHPNTPSGRDGFYYVAATNLRLGRASEAVARYIEYVERFPEGERIEQAHLNIIDSLREAQRSDEAKPWIERTRARFSGTAADANALFARLRLDISRGDWQSAIRTSEELNRTTFQKGVSTSRQEVAYLRAYSLERSGQKEQAMKAFQAIPDSLGSYFGWLATERLREMGGEARKDAVSREARVRNEAARMASSYPAPYSEIILRAVRGRSVDPRFMLAIMRQESSFKPRAKSPAGARGLMQLTTDAASKYAPVAGYGRLSEEELYLPEISIKIAAAYLDDLSKMFSGVNEAVAASYNGGEDNVERWVRRAGQKDPGVITSEVGFTESKDYVQKVLSNYRAYKLLYSDKLNRK